jgi:HEXXH motif-containing protein
MVDLAGVFEFPAIEEFHRRRMTRLAQVLRPGDPTDWGGDSDPAVRVALAHHFLEGAEAAARRNDREMFAFCRQAPLAAPSDAVVSSPWGPRVALSPHADELVQLAVSDTPIYLVGPGARPAVGDERAVVEAAYADGDRMGFGALMRTHAVVVCLLTRREVGDVLNSWSITRLPGTIFTDHVGESSVLGRDLVHEASHSWLNDVLVAFDIKLSEEVTFYSPWKDTQRPAFGFIHACWAFPLTMLYTDAILPNVSPPVAAYLNRYLTKQREMLPRTEGDHERALELITVDDLRDRLRRVYRAALEL